MKQSRTIILGNLSGEAVWRERLPGRILFFASQEKDAYLYQLDNVQVDSYILDMSLKGKEIEEIGSRIHYLNALVHIYILRERLISAPDSPVDNLSVLDNPGDITKAIKEIPEDQRSFNRAYWPIHSEYWFSDSPRLRYQGIVLSISAGGCFIRTDHSQPERSIMMYIHFREFRFLVEGEVLRTRTPQEGAPGLAIKFKNISPQTDKFIEEIINEKILTRLMEKMDIE